MGNLYRPPDSKIEYNDQFEYFLDTISKEGKELIFLGHFIKNLAHEHSDREWLNFTMFLGLRQMISQHTRVTPTGSTLTYHIYTNMEENINRTSISKISISDHYAIFGNRKLNFSIGKHCHQFISYRSFQHFDEHAFIQDLSLISTIGSHSVLQ